MIVYDLNIHLDLFDFYVKLMTSSTNFADLFPTEGGGWGIRQRVTKRGTQSERMRGNRVDNFFGCYLFTNYQLMSGHHTK